MNEGTKVRVQVRTTLATYKGDLFIPAKRNRLSDVINEPGPIFINLTNVEMDGASKRIEHLVLNKRLIESVRSLERKSAVPAR